MYKALLIGIAYKMYDKKWFERATRFVIWNIKVDNY